MKKNGKRIKIEKGRSPIRKDSENLAKNLMTQQIPYQKL